MGLNRGYRNLFIFGASGMGAVQNRGNTVLYMGIFVHEKKRKCGSNSNITIFEQLDENVFYCTLGYINL